MLSGLSDKDLGRAEGGLASLPGYAPGGPVGFTGAKSWPSIRADAKAFDQILEIANFKDKSARKFQFLSKMLYNTALFSKAQIRLSQK